MLKILLKYKFWFVLSLYVVMVLVLTGQAVWWKILLLGVFTLSPDTDFVPYLVAFKLLPKRKRPVSHWIFFHWPLVWLIAGNLVLMVFLDVYAIPAILAFAVLSALHFEEDAKAVFGLRFLFPIKWAAYKIVDGKFVRVPEDKRKELYRRRREESWHNSILDELKDREGETRKGWYDKNK